MFTGADRKELELMPLEILTRDFTKSFKEVYNNLPNNTKKEECWRSLLVKVLSIDTFIGAYEP